MKKYVAVLILTVVFCSASFAQLKKVKVIQFSGYAMTADSLMGVPFAHITILNRGRVATAGPDGFFSVAAVEGDTLYFSSIGYKPTVYLIPKNLETEKFTMLVMMTKSDIYLRETVIFPWRREDFHQVFMDTHPPEDALDRAKRNLDRERLAALGEKMDLDGPEAGNRSLRNSAAKNYYYGQTAPQNIFNPLAWAQFIQAWKNGDFKKKSNNSDTNTPVDPSANPQY